MKKIIILLLCLLPFCSNAQLKITKNDWGLAATQFSAGMFRGCREQIQAGHWGTGQFWDMSISWRNKYKNGDPAQGPKFFGSTNIFVAFTDGYHATHVGITASYLATITVALHSKEKLTVPMVAKKLLICLLSNSTGFVISEQIFKR